MRKLQAFEATGLKDSRPSRGNPVNPVPTNVTGGILAAQDSTGIPVPVPCEDWLTMHTCQCLIPPKRKMPCHA